MGLGHSNGAPVAANRVDGYLLAVPVDFRISSARIRYSHHVIVKLRTGDLVGVGEGVLYRTLPHQCAELFQRLVRPILEKSCPLNGGANELGHWLTRLVGASPALAYAVDAALWDLSGKEAGKPVADLLGGAYQRQIPVTEQVMIRDWATAEAELEAILSRGTRRLKLKIGTSPQADLETTRRVRAFLGPAFEIRVDANRAYSLAEGEALYRKLADLGILALEEPLSGRNWADLRTLRGRVGLPVILDENVLGLDDLEKAIAEAAVDVLNLKLTRLGGVSQALRYAEVCRRHGVGTALGCTEDMGVGTAAIVHTAAALPNLHSMEGLGPLRLGFDVIAEGWQVVDGSLALPQEAGLGVTLPPGWQDRIPARVRRFDLSADSRRLKMFSHYARWYQRANNLLWRVQRRRAA